MPVKRLATLRRALDVLELIGRQPQSAVEISAALEVDRSALQRVLATLDDEGWARCRARDRRWELGPAALVTLGAGPDAGLVSRARPVLMALRDESAETAFLAIGGGDRVVVADVAESPQLVRLAPQVGMVIDADLSAAVLAIAAFVPTERATGLLRASANAPRFAKELEATRVRGWSLHAGVVHSGAASIAAPVFGHGGEPIAAIVVCCPTARLPVSAHEHLGAAVVRAASEVSLASL